MGFLWGRRGAARGLFDGDCGGLLVRPVRGLVVGAGVQLGGGLLAGEGCQGVTAWGVTDPDATAAF
ncbi:hypothetical protein SDC9_161214 [bioreactor metagenome]|uniref:Uncharacterized protein n=1 Tax=bioreactor metagenome TaxID=1076179 RepID=A0A645FHL4_9ZZZZ